MFIELTLIEYEEWWDEKRKGGMKVCINRDNIMCFGVDADTPTHTWIVLNRPLSSDMSTFTSDDANLNDICVKESYDAIKAKLMPGFKTNDGVAERLRKREEFFKGK